GRWPRLRFNVATGADPWRTMAPHPQRMFLMAASMWPRVRTRGEPRIHHTTRTRQERFNVATGADPWRTEPRTNVCLLGVELQCGHGCGPVENEAIAARVAADGIASMWPRVRTRGELVAAGLVRNTSEASM